MFNDDAIWKNLNSPRRLFLIAGPCVIENEKLCLQTAASLKKTCAALGIFYVFKDEALREQFLANRYRRRAAVPRKRLSVAQ